MVVIFIKERFRNVNVSAFENLPCSTRKLTSDADIAMRHNK